jgi:hypothetical protein
MTGAEGILHHLGLLAVALNDYDRLSQTDTPRGDRASETLDPLLTSLRLTSPPSLILDDDGCPGEKARALARQLFGDQAVELLAQASADEVEARMEEAMVIARLAFCARSGGSRFLLVASAIAAREFDER